MNTHFGVSACDENVPMVADREEVTKINLCVVRVIEKKEPLFAVLGKPEKCVICNIAYLFRSSDSLKI
jgi:hypothetical protein